MCGFCGFVGHVMDQDSIIKKMTDIIVHRGPDSDGFFAHDNIAMGFRRLSIIDLEQGSQPLYNEGKTLILTFNGEIYNYKELRRELTTLGHSFVTDTDSEVLIHGFEEWRESLLDRLRGMFAFAIFSRDDNSLFLARDFFGIKPMHYAMCNETFIYASEIKSILAFPGFERIFNTRALDSYLSFQYVVPPETFFEGIYCLPPGHYLWYRGNGIEITRYFDPTLQPDESLDLEDAVNRIEAVFEDSINMHKTSDVEIGSFLSSGVDSSYVSTYFAGQKTFTVGFDFGEKYNEISFAKRLAEHVGAEHHYKIISSEEFWGNIEKVQYHMDQPLADPSCIALYFVSQLASQYVKVVLSGEGADELFGGYNIYHEPYSLYWYQKLLPKSIRRLIAKILCAIPFHFPGKSFALRASDTLQERYIGNAFMFTKAEKDQLLKDPSISTRPQEFCREIYRKAQSLDDISQMQHLDINLWMVGDILLKADRMSMANSLELRVPFLDKEVFKVAASLPYRLKVTKSTTKHALRLAAARHMPPESAQKRKLGFPVPTRVWLRDEKYYNIVKEAFASDTASAFFDTGLLMKYLSDHYAGHEDDSRKIWTIYIFLVWYGIYFK